MLFLVKVCQRNTNSEFADMYLVLENVNSAKHNLVFFTIVGHSQSSQYISSSDLELALVMTFLQYRDVLRKVITLPIPTEISRENARASVLWDT